MNGISQERFYYNKSEVYIPSLPPTLREAGYISQPILPNREKESQIKVPLSIWEGIQGEGISVQSLQLWFLSGKPALEWGFTAISRHHR
ncbi:hypothetical protein J5X98_01530 [Leptothermofonsia sichuanensis E412]|uniref:hypothetical protein n=1 Tax=Leptothermofonsia sichuanensis TaxID=2917832 RepID=UPI001CA71609|nr:hypothetical protein [Leptothermofonsia sichuanensis]QZZ21210.1 hypothetical protein J5X98_01530 [Leptothermofonsia sichuanensis E412]